MNDVMSWRSLPIRSTSKKAEWRLSSSETGFLGPLPHRGHNEKTLEFRQK